MYIYINIYIIHQSATYANRTQNSDVPCSSSLPTLPGSAQVLGGWRWLCCRLHVPYWELNACKKLSEAQSRALCLFLSRSRGNLQT